MEKSPSNNSNKFSKKKLPEKYIRYSSLGMQMGATIFLMTYGGLKLDRWLQLRFPVFTLTFLFVSIFGSLYIVYRSLKDDK